MLSQYQQFKALHELNTPLLLPNSWDARSALVFQENGYAAIATSSAAVANGLGYEDGEQMSFSDYLFMIRRIAAK